MTKLSVSAAQKSLIETMQRISFGRIEGLAVVNGQPNLDHARIIEEIKIGGVNGPRPELSFDDFHLRNSVIEFLEHLTKLGNATVPRIQVRYGLPCALEVERGTSPSDDRV